jgi:hypothetical protein
LHRVSQVAGIAAALVAATLLIRSTVVRLWDYDASDFAPLYLAGAVVAAGDVDHLYDHHASRFNELESEAYDRAARDARYRGDMRPFVQPPWVAAVARPLTLAPFDVVGRALLIANVLAVLLGIALLDRELQLGMLRPWPATAMLLLLHEFEPVRTSTELGQTTPLVFLALVLVWVLDRRERQVAAGLVLASVAAFKLAPALLVAAFLLRKRMRAVYAFAAGGASLALAGLVFVGWSASTTFAARVIELSGQSFPAFNNQSVAGFVLRFQYPSDNTLSWRLYRLAPLHTLLSLAVLAGGVACAWYCWRRARREHRDGLLYGMLIVVMLLVPSISWNHYYIYALIPAAAAWRARTPDNAVPVGILLAVGLCLMLRYFGLGSWRSLHGNVFMSAYVVGAVLIFGAMVSVALARHGNANDAR